MKIAYHYVGGVSPVTRYMIKSARKVFPGVDIVHMTDRHTPSLGDATLRSSGTTDQPMVHRLESMAALMQQVDEPVLFVDYDVLFVSPPEWDGDVGLTYREPEYNAVSRSMPFNTGVIYATVGSRYFWIEAAKIARALPPDLKKWYGDQIAIALMVGLETHRRMVFGTKIDYRPCLTHNLTPEEEPREKPDAHILHFKGNRKQWMACCFKTLFPST